ncbi:LCP family protein [Streptomyces sp. NPDC051315]|uniref:LCP family protein n=1 Tax=Streptomyces sp. NPDC051315 TaxID=3365650 RepID=UPI0037943B2E
MKRYRRLRRPAMASVVLATMGALLGSGTALPGRQDAPRAMNILVMGTDGRDTITDAERRAFHAGGRACGCTDVLMLVHLSARRDRVSVIGLPRDSYARIPAHRDQAGGRERPAHPAKINAAFREGGPELAVRTVESMTGVSVDRHLQVDFRRFMDTVDEVGGVEVCTPRRLRDSATGIDLAPGTHRLGGGRALQYVRARHADGSADLGRIRRQQRFLVQALRQVRVSGVLSEPARTARMVRTLLGSGPQGFGFVDLARLAAALHRLPASATEFTTVPIGRLAPAEAGVGSALMWDREKADALFARIRADRPLVEKGTHPRPKEPPSIVGSPAPVRGSAYACS